MCRNGNLLRPLRFVSTTRHLEKPSHFTGVLCGSGQRIESVICRGNCGLLISPTRIAPSETPRVEVVTSLPMSWPEGKAGQDTYGVDYS